VTAGITTLGAEEAIASRCRLKLIERERLLLRCRA
jgi:hypothetical protein